MKYDLTVAGGAYNRRLFYTAKNQYQELRMPGGAALLERILAENGKSVAPVPMDDESAWQFLELKQGGPSGGFYLEKSAGWRDGTCCVAPAAAAAALLYDACPGKNGLESASLKDGTPVLWAARHELPDRKAFRQVSANTFLMIDVDVLRKKGGLVSKQISWERTATDLVWQIYYNPAFAYLLLAPHILVTFAEDALIHIAKGGGKPRATLALGHGNAEGYLREKCGCALPDTWAAMVASTALQFEDVLKGKELRCAPILLAGQQLLETGYDLGGISEGKFGGMALGEADEELMHKSQVPIPHNLHTSDPDYWCISDGFQNTNLYKLAFETVKLGLTRLKGLPQLSFGALTTVDRREIESFQNIRNLITEYASGKASKPLSIAVFGPPGSGKSFGVTQIAKNVLEGVQKLEFNVSQFRGPDDLSAAFHSVRDCVLSGKLPLVFFDEFDSDRDGQPLGWLKSFLMPMQDGKFKDVSGEHPVGKCIMVFAGGTSPTFEDFTSPMGADDPAIATEFKNIKGPDFVSRLRGSINILGPNPAYEGDKNYILRRAILLRSLCERKLDTKKDDGFIDDNVLKAMLVLDRYKHGARSMEAILDMSRLKESTFSPATLPFYAQLDLHVDADAFLRLVLQDVTMGSYIEELAHVIHDDFVKKNPKNSNAKPWSKLSPFLQESNREQARRMGIKLNLAGFSYDEGDTPFETVEAFTPEETKFLSILEHNMWVEERLEAGWTLGPKKDDVKKTNPNIKPWEQLTEEVQQYDVDVTDNIIPFLKRIGMRVYRTL